MAETQSPLPSIGLPLGSVLPMTNRQEATVIAALTLWRAVIAGQVDVRGISGDRLAMVASDDNLHEPLTPAEVDELLADVFRVAA